MAEFLIQMPLNLLWYPKEIEIPNEDNKPHEYDWDLVPDGQRPTEEAVMRSVGNWPSGAIRVVKQGLGATEYKACRLELESYRKCPRHYNQAEREKWIAKEMGLGVLTVKDILLKADKITFQAMVIEEIEKSHRELVREVMAEMFPYFKRDAA